MTTESAKPRVNFSWTPPAKEAVSRPDWGTYVPNLPVDVPMPEKEPAHEQSMAAMTRTFEIGRDNTMYWLTSPDQGLGFSFRRPDLYPAIAIAMQCLEAVRQELLHGPRRTYLGPDGQWHVEEESEDTKALRRRAELKDGSGRPD